MAVLLKHLLCFLFLFSSLFHSSSSRPQPFAMRISCGARQNVHTLPTNTLWYRDFGYTGGRPANATTSSYIDPPLKTLRYFPLSDGPENCYNINRVPRGHYLVRIFFGLVAEPNSNSNSGGDEPLFDISVQGTQIYSMKSGWSTGDDQSFTEASVFVRDATVSACFHSTGHGDPAILSIEILQLDDKAYYFGPNWGQGLILRAAQRLTCGSGRSEFDVDYNGNIWGGDRFWKGVKTFGQGSDQPISTENKIQRTSAAPNYYPDKLYRTALVSTDNQPDLSYTMDVDPNKNYSIWLHFAEIDNRVRKAGERVFNVLINGNVAFKDVDVIKMSGDLFTALVLNQTVAVNGRSLTITFQPTKGDHAIINAIEVFEVIPAESRTSIEEVRALQTLKNTLGLPLRFGWNGDPCVPQQHPWSGVDCQFDSKSLTWVIDGLGLDNQGLRGFLPNDISKLRHLQSINLSENSIHGIIPSSLGTITSLQTLNQNICGSGSVEQMETQDLSFNLFNGSIPESLGHLTSLRRLNLNSNFLSGRVPAVLGERLLHRASFNFTANAGLCGIPGLRACGPHLSTGAKIGIAIGAFVAFLLVLLCSVCWWIRRQNILRAQKIAARDAPYAKSRTNFTRDVQMNTRHHNFEQPRAAAENGPHLLS